MTGEPSDRPGSDAEAAGRGSEHRGRGWLWLAGGVAALVGGTLLGANPTLLDAVATPPAIVRAALVAVAMLVALRFLGMALQRLEAGRARASDELTGRDVAVLVRGVRYVFLAVAAFAAAAGWLLGSALPFVVALVIAGVDIVETSFLMLVVAMRGDAADGLDRPTDQA